MQKGTGYNTQQLAYFYIKSKFTNLGTAEILYKILVKNFEGFMFLIGIFCLNKYAFSIIVGMPQQ